MRILAIETSCDETAVAIVEGRGSYAHPELSMLGAGVHSQIAAHRQYGGVYPTVAKREHTTNLVPVFMHAIQQAGLFREATQPLSPHQLFTLQGILEREPELFNQLSGAITTFEKPDIDAIAVTYGPGLEPALWIGINFAKALAAFWQLPIIPVNHMEGHVLSVLLQEDGSQVADMPALPMLTLLVSGGHTQLVLMRDWLDYEILGSTKDDALGEAFDKAARLLNLPYPGGPEISKLAAYAREHEYEPPFTLPRPLETSDDYQFSYSGLKTALRYKLEEYESLTDEQRAGIARAFEDAALAPIFSKTRRAIREYGPATLAGAGGVIANPTLRSGLEQIAAAEGLACRLAPASLATDNAAMIGAAGYYRALAGHYAEPETIVADSTASLG